MTDDDPARTDPDRYHVMFENDRVRVLEHLDVPGGKTQPHRHPDSVLYTPPWKRCAEPAFPGGR
jgi:beta-alanine degradation protein BauB